MHPNVVARFVSLSLLLSAVAFAVSPETEEKIDNTLQKVLKPVAVATDFAVRTSEAVSERWEGRSPRVREIFDVNIPGALEKYRLTVNFEPKIGDLVKRRYVRFPIELRYGLNNRTEVYGGLTPFSPNPFHKDRSSWGLGFFTQGLRYNVLPIGRKLGFDEITVGAEARIPVGNPPVRLIDQYTHIKPYVTTARYLDSLRHTTLFLSASYDFAQKWENTIPPGIVERDTLEVGPSLLYKPSEWGAFGQVAFRHFTEPDRTLLGSISRLGGIWDIPEERSTKWGLKGNWRVEMALEVETEDGKSADFGVATRVRWNFDLK
ncbi:MAG: hypothetical protein SFV32_03110 [Opitutaceae bacterium]|nr:hypothetical protein [Opitutaceae bacterium]